MTDKTTKIFISHSSQDLAFVKPLVELFECMGVSPDNMFCSSVPGYNVPLDTNIFDYLKKQFQQFDLRVFFVLSENYYNSPASLNEMGAAWVLQHKYTSILVPNFDFRDIKGVIDQMRISIHLNAESFELKSRLNELRDTLSEELRLKKNSFNIWERHRDEFIKKISSTEVYWNEIRQLREKNRPLEDWILPLYNLIEVNPSSYDAMYMLGSIYAEKNSYENAIKYLKMTIKLSPNDDLKEKAKTRLQQIGYTI